MSNFNYNADTEALAIVLDHPRARPIAGQYLGKIMVPEAGEPNLSFEQSIAYPTNGVLNWNATSPTRVLDWSGSFLSTNAISEVLWFHYNGHDVPYTNGVAAVEDADQNLTGTLNFNQLGAHRAWSYPYLGGIQEIVIFSKTNWSAADIAAWHCYCTTTYGFSP